MSRLRPRDEKGWEGRARAGAGGDLFRGGSAARRGAFCQGQSAGRLAVPAAEWLWLGVSGGTFRRGMPLKQRIGTAERIRHMKPPTPDPKGLCENQDRKDAFLAYRPLLFLESLSAVPMYNRGVVPGHALPHRGLPFVQPRRAVLAPSGGWAFFRRQTCGSPYRETPATVRCVFGRHGSGRGP